METPEIYIVGSGAIGKALAVFLKLENKKVTLVRGSVDNVPGVSSQITVTADSTYRQEVPVTTFSELSIINGIVLITTKTFANHDIAKKLSKVIGVFSIVLLQNGLNIELSFKNFEKVFRCVLLSTSQVIDENEIIFKSITSSPVGNINGNNQGLDMVIDQINTTYFEFRKEQNIAKYIWNKAITNCAFNSICPLLETDNGIFYRNEDARRLANAIIKECVSLAHVLGVHLDESEIEESLILISQKSTGRLISTYVDILNNRRTEIESLNLEIARMADEIGKPDLVTVTKLLGRLILLKSDESRRKQ
ncbi:MAG: 2-dehydropantoate 2-reductase [Bacteroidota bacterium]